MSKIGNTVQCGVFMLDGGEYARQFPIPRTGSFSELGIPNDADDRYIVYPGFKVEVSGEGERVYLLDNTSGTIPIIFTAEDINRGSFWRVYYMNEQITGSGTVTTSIVSVNNNIGNSVQCGVYMIDHLNGDGRGLFPVPFTGNTDGSNGFSANRVPSNVDNYYVVFPGFKVNVRQNPEGTGNSSTYVNTSGTMPAVFTATYRDEGSYWQVFYMEDEIGVGNTGNQDVISEVNNNIANTIQCGVFLIDTGEYTYPIARSGTKTSLYIKRDADDYYLVYPGFCVYAYDGANYEEPRQIFNNTYGTSPQIFTSNNSSASWRVFYMRYKILEQP
jgi:hypothetical protein